MPAKGFPVKYGPFEGSACLPYSMVNAHSCAELYGSEAAENLSVRADPVICRMFNIDQLWVNLHIGRHGLSVCEQRHQWGGLTDLQHSTSASVGPIGGHTTLAITLAL